jgi:hypothetical protein
LVASEAGDFESGGRFFEFENDEGVFGGEGFGVSGDTFVGQGRGRDALETREGTFTGNEVVNEGGGVAGCVGVVGSGNDFGVESIRPQAGSHSVGGYVEIASN